MVEYARHLSLSKLLAKKSFFLLGPRATGKSYLVHKELGDRAVILDLLASDLYLRLAAEPWQLEALIDGRRSGTGRPLVVVDEVQKVPGLLDEVHRLIESRGIRFLLTGSSARKLRRGNANLLAGRAWMARLFPLTSTEIPRFDLDRYLRFGGLPAVYGSDEPDEELNAYVRTYLHQEIQAEGLVRKIPQFSRFLVTAALANGQLLNFAQLSSDAAVPASTLKEHYAILEDTLVGFSLEPWTRSLKRKAIGTAKFYFFDLGVTHSLAGTKALDRNSDLYGRAFEHWVAMELRAHLSYARRTDPLGFWRSTHQHEVDFIVGDETAIETKATRRVAQRDLKGLRALAEEGRMKKLLLVSQDPTEMVTEGVRCLHWRSFVDELWAGTLV